MQQSQGFWRKKLQRRHFEKEVGVVENRIKCDDCGIETKNMQIHIKKTYMVKKWDIHVVNVILKPFINPYLKNTNIIYNTTHILKKEN